MNFPMELISPWIFLYIGIPIMIILPFWGFKRKDKFKKGSKVANAGSLESTKLYKWLMRSYKFMGFLGLLCLLAAIGISFLLMSRPVKYETVTYEIKNRDIFLCMDISSSVDQLNLDICEELRGVVRDLEGERVGITIFNAKSVLLVPLTTDYEYILQILDELEESLEVSMQLTEYYESPYIDYSFFDDFDYETYYYKYEGTLSDYGSSYIGDGLASCLYNFPDLEEDEDRTRIIIFTTDNELNGVPFVTVDEAADLCAKHGVRVYAIAPHNVVDEANFKAAIERTGGVYYRNTSPRVYDDLVDEIKATEANITVEAGTLSYDQPKQLFTFLVLAVGIYYFMFRRMKL